MIWVPVYLATVSALYVLVRLTVGRWVTRGWTNRDRAMALFCALVPPLALVAAAWALMDSIDWDKQVKW